MSTPFLKKIIEVDHQYLSRKLRDEIEGTAAALPPPPPMALARAIHTDASVEEEQLELILRQKEALILAINRDLAKLRLVNVELSKIPYFKPSQAKPSQRRKRSRRSKRKKM